jgi:hypothetical protein
VDRSPSFEVDPEDKVTTALARALLAAELVTQLLTAFMILEMVERGQITYKLAWHWRSWRARVRASEQGERAWRKDLGAMFYDAERTLRGAPHG